ncbi:MAG TPA: adenylate/guanylate cyclase domain-containing protein [Anaerolineales bacterium]|nr:adenylate/guanylate cyclase domain-containing protein [Anaerolineales bacterium]
MNPQVRSLHASFFFVDIVGLSDPDMSTALQVRKITFLNDLISRCQAFANSPIEAALVLPTGDGMAIGFVQSPELPLKLAMELHEKIKDYNRGKLPNELLRVRIGIHSGPVFIVKDLRGNDNVWGQGIIIARRVMDLGDDGHILLSSRVAEDLRQLSHEYLQIIHPIEKYTVKHNVQLLIYSAYGKNFGNPKLPGKMKSKIDDFQYREIVVTVRIVDPQSMKVRYTRACEIQNISGRPATNVTHQIATDVEKTFDDLKIKIYDEKGTALRIATIELDALEQKEFTTSFAGTLEVGERTKYFLEYEVEEPERYFENSFFTNCKRFVLVFDSPSELSLGIMKPVLYEVNPESGQKHKSEKVGHFDVVEGRDITSWEFPDVSKGQSIRIEW